MQLNIDIPSTLVGLALSLVCSAFFFWLALAQRNPKLVGTGGGTGTLSIPNRDVMGSSISIRNEASFLGMKAPRDAAEIVSARLFDPELREYLGPALSWREEGTHNVVPHVSIGSGKNAELFVFAKDRHSPDFFVFEGEGTNRPLAESPTLVARDKRHFEVHLRDSIGRAYKFRITARNGGQSVDVAFKLTLANRRQMIGRGLRTIIAAFRLRQ